MEAIRNPQLRAPTNTSITWPIILITLGFLSYTSYKYVNMERETIIAHWAEQRCNPFVMAVAYYLKPDTDPQSPGVAQRHGSR